MWIHHASILAVSQKPLPGLIPSHGEFSNRSLSHVDELRIQRENHRKPVMLTSTSDDSTTIINSYEEKALLDSHAESVSPEPTEENSGLLLRS